MMKKEKPDKHSKRTSRIAPASATPALPTVSGLGSAIATAGTASATNSGAPPDRRPSLASAALPAAQATAHIDADFSAVSFGIKANTEVTNQFAAHSPSASGTTLEGLLHTPPGSLHHAAMVSGGHHNKAKTVNKTKTVNRYKIKQATFTQPPPDTNNTDASLTPNRAYFLPALSEHFVARPTLQTTLQSRFQSPPAASQLTRYVLHGLGGSGKSELALWYATHATLYTHRIWLSADTELSLQTAYRNLGLQWNLPGFAHLSPEGQRDTVLHWLSQHPGWLLVYDNADETGWLEAYLPRAGGHVLLTSRNPYLQWRDDERLLITEAMQPDEAVALLAKHHQQPDPDHAPLAAILNFLPLALVQAGAYLREQREISALTVGEYGQQVTRDTTLVLSPGQTVSSPRLQVGATWRLSFQALQQKDPRALELLQACAYLDPDHVPRPLLLGWLQRKEPGAKETSETRLNQLVSAVMGYSLLSAQRRESTLEYRLHRLVQATLREQAKPHHPELHALLELTLHAVTHDAGSLTHTWQRWEQQQVLETLQASYRACLGTDNLPEVYLESVCQLASIYDDLGLIHKQQQLTMDTLRVLPPAHPKTVILQTWQNQAEQRLKVRSHAATPSTEPATHRQLAEQDENEFLQQQLFFYIPPRVKQVTPFFANEAGGQADRTNTPLRRQGMAHASDPGTVASSAHTARQRWQLARQHVFPRDLPWEGVVRHFLTETTSRLLLLQGESGAGKSLCLLALKRPPAGRYSLVPPSFQPRILHIELKRYDKRSAASCVARTIVGLAAPANQLAAWQAGPTLLLLDGYDEIAGGAPGNLYDLNGLKAWTQLKVIISCRTQALQPGFERDFIPAGLSGSPGSLPTPLAVFYQLTPFSEAERDGYLERYTRYHANQPGALRVQDYQQAFETLPGLAELVSTPLLLRIATEALPLLLQEQSHYAPGKQEAGTPTSVTTLLRVNLYDAFMRQWFANQAVRLQKNSALANLPHASATFFDFSKRLALAMAAAQQVEIHYQPNNPEQVIWAQFFADQDSRVRTARQGCPLRQTGMHRYSFVHKSFLEYFMARGIWDALCLPLHEPERVTQSGVQPGFMLAEPAVIAFLQELASQQPRQIDTLFQWLIQSRERPEPDYAKAAACSATLLNALHVPFYHSHYPLQGVRLPGADLRGALLGGVDLRKADLQSTQFNATDLRQVQLQGARLHHSHLGQAPFLQFKTSVMSVAWHPRQALLAIGFIDGKLLLWDTQRGQVSRTLSRLWPFLDAHQSAVTGLAFSPDGRFLASGSEDTTVRLWNVATGALHTTLKGHSDSVRSVAFSPDGATLASGSGDNTVRVWNVATGALRTTLKGHSDSVKSVAFSPDGATLASGSEDNTVRVWNVATGALHSTLKGHSDSVTSVAFSPDGATLASGSEDNTVRVWNVATGALHTTMKGHSNGVMSVAFSLDGATLASGSSDTMFRSSKNRHIF